MFFFDKNKAQTISQNWPLDLSEGIRFHKIKISTINNGKCRIYLILHVFKCPCFTFTIQTSRFCLPQLACNADWAKWLNTKRRDGELTDDIRSPVAAKWKVGQFVNQIWQTAGVDANCVRIRIMIDYSRRRRATDPGTLSSDLCAAPSSRAKNLHCKSANK